MNFTFEIAKRYLFAKKSTNAINLITGISVLGIAIGTAALILILSVFNGFESLISEFLDDFNPDLKIVPTEGKRFALEEDLYTEILQLAHVEAVSKTLEEVALFEYGDAQEVGVVKGVDEHYAKVTKIDSTIKEGSFKLKENDIRFGVIGSVLARRLSINIQDPFEELTVYSPQKRRSGPLDKDFRTRTIYPSGIFSIQNENDQEYILTSYDLVSQLLDANGEVTSIEVKLTASANEKMVSSQIAGIIGPEYIVKNRYDQDEVFLKIMNLEKWMSFLIVGLTILIVAFNLVGCLWMIVLEKKFDISVLKSLGFDSQGVRQIFIKEGLLISGIGLLLGITLALCFYLAQKNFGLINMSDGFIVDAYPIELKIFDFFVVIAMVLLIGFIASLPASLKASRIEAYIRAE